MFFNTLICFLEILQLSFENFCKFKGIIPCLFFLKSLNIYGNVYRENKTDLIRLNSQNLEMISYVGNNCQLLTG